MARQLEVVKGSAAGPKQRKCAGRRRLRVLAAQSAVHCQVLWSDATKPPEPAAMHALQPCLIQALVLTCCDCTGTQEDRRRFLLGYVAKVDPQIMEQFADHAPNQVFARAPSLRVLPSSRGLLASGLPSLPDMG